MATAIGTGLLILVAFLALIFVSEAFEAYESPFVVAHKKVTLSKLKNEVQRVSVSIDIYNKGSASAYDLSLTDDSWAKDIFETISGNTTKSWDRLDVGSVVSHTFELESRTKTIYYGAPAVITFRIPVKNSQQVAYSTPILPLDILADRIQAKYFELAKGYCAKYGSHIGVVSAVLLFAHLITSPKSTAAKRSKKKN